MQAHTIDFLRLRRTPRLGWLLLVAGALAVGLAARLEEDLDLVRATRDKAIAQRERDDALERQRLEIAARPTPEGHRLAAATRETHRPWLVTLQSVEAATAPPLYVLDFTVDPTKGRVHLEGEAPDFESAVDYVERLGRVGGVVQPRLTSHEQATDSATARPLVKFTVDANWSVAP